MHRVPWLPVDALAVDLRPALPRLDELDRVPGVAMDRRRRTRRDLVDRRVEVHRRAIAVATGKHTAAHAPRRDVVHDDVLPLQDGLVVALPLVEERLAPLLLDLVCRLLLGNDYLHRDAAAAGAFETRRSTSFAKLP